MRLINTDGSNEGILSVDEAFEKACQLGNDLVVVNKDADIPVCKIIDFEKYEYEQEKRSKRQHKRQIKTKEYSFNPVTEYHDINTMIKKCLKNLEKGHRILFIIRFTKRYANLRKVGMEKMLHIEQELKDVAVVEKKKEVPSYISFLFVNKPKS